MWYNDGNMDRIVDDEVGYTKFLTWAKGQAEGVVVTIEKGFRHSASPE